MANDSALEQRIQIHLGSNKAIIIVKTILGDYYKKKKRASRVSTKYVILFCTYEIRDEIMRFRFQTKVSDLRDAKNETRFFLFLIDYWP